MIDLSVLGLSQSLSAINNIINEGSFPCRVKLRDEVTFMNAERFLKQNRVTYITNRTDNSFIIELKSHQKKKPGTVVITVNNEITKEYTDYLLSLLNGIADGKEIGNVLFTGLYASMAIAKKRVILVLIKLKKCGINLYISKYCVDAGAVPEHADCLNIDGMASLIAGSGSVLYL